MKKMSFFLLFSVCFAMMIPAAYGEGYYGTLGLDVKFYRDNTPAEITDVNYVSNQYSTFFAMMGTGSYAVRILDKDETQLYANNFDVIFAQYLRMEDGGEQAIDINELVKHFRFALTLESRYIVFYNNGILLLRIDLEDYLCNRNSVCENGENSYNCQADCRNYCGDGICSSAENKVTCQTDCVASSCGNNICEENEDYEICRSDCPSGSKDGYCDLLKDGVCDPDCPDKDTDCGILTDSTHPKEKTPLSPSTIVAIGLLLLVGLVIFIILMEINRQKGLNYLDTNKREKEEDNKTPYQNSTESLFDKYEKR